MFPGWAHTEASLAPLAEALFDHFESLPGLSGPQDVDGPCIVLGWSMGGMKAIELAAEHPEKVESLILISSTAKFCAAENYPYGTSESALRGMTAALRRNPRRVLSDFFSQCAAPFTLSGPELEKKIDQAMNISLDELVSGLHYLQRTDLRTIFEKVKAPCLILHGRDDQIIPSDASLWMGRRLSNSRLELLDGLGHDLPIRRPNEVASYILRYQGGRLD